MVCGSEIFDKGKSSFYSCLCNWQQLAAAERPQAEAAGKLVKEIFPLIAEERLTLSNSSNIITSGTHLTHKDREPLWY